MRRLSLIAAMLILVSPPAQAAGPAIEIEHAWIREAPPGATVLAAYMTLRNPGHRPDRLIRVQTPVAGRVEVHETLVVNGVMRMRPVGQLLLPDGQTVVLKPKGTHMMLMDLKRPVKAGMRIPVTFTFERAGTIRRDLPVTRAD
ncbi:MAG TPA: copper chaperone PCu(A)C [Stenomitos sp.]